MTTWWKFVKEASGDDDQVTIATKAGVSQSMVSRWQTSQPRPESAAAFARAYGRPVLEAFVAAGIITAAEARQRPAAPLDLSQVPSEDLIDEVRARLVGGSSDAGQAEDEKSRDDGREGGRVTPIGRARWEMPGQAAARRGQRARDQED